MTCTLQDADEPCPIDEHIAAELGAVGRSVVPGVLGVDDVRELARDLRRAEERGAFHQAGVGRGPSFRVDPGIRGDGVLWLEPAEATRAQRRYFERMEELRRALNLRLTLGLFGFEAHLALYPPGARYEAHFDRFATAPQRTVSTSLYLNEDWKVSDGGALRLYLEGSSSGTFEDVQPLGGTLVVFASDRFLHEVLPARRERLAITGWFTRRP